ncbi:MAG: Mur ligase family protein [Candidatus Margulisiibacteriota bacterium]|jgi:UDP-N-acetylmuramoyl-tripeptide--D-alanyl-D-alanine ligase
MKISIDTRTLQPGDIYIPIKGANFDGHNFIEDAIKKGARKILDVDLNKFAAQYRKKLKCKVIAITGSAGKTTTKDLLTAVLSQKFKVVSTFQNQNNEIGVPLTILKAEFDTDVIIVELGMRLKGEIKALAKIVRPTHTVITNIGLTHVERLKTQRNIALAKAEIFQPTLRWEEPERIAYLNYNTPYYDLLKYKAEKNNFKLFSFSGETKTDQNFNLCYLVARQFGLSNEEIKKGIESFTPSEHRLNLIKSKQITIIDDAYNANPDGVNYALEYLSQFSGRKILVFGDMLELGNQTLKEHQKVLAKAWELGIDLICTFGEILHKIENKNKQKYAFLNKKALIKFLYDEIKPKDIVLIKGSRGMKMEEIVEALKVKYD